MTFPTIAVIKTPGDLPGLEEKWARLAQTTLPSGALCVAFSGGVDSTFLAWAAKELFQKEVILFFADSALITERERDSALRIASWLALDLQIVKVDLLALPEIRANPVDRCYFCKKRIFRHIISRADELGCSAVADGSHAGDPRYRPGKKALVELGILSPLAKAGLIKDEIRLLSRAAGIPNWNKPSQSCLATRVPYGTPLDSELLSKIEQAESFLYRLGCRQVRMRCHGDLARIESEVDAIQILASPETREKILKKFGELGFAHIALDLAGFRSGCWDKHEA